MKKFRFIKGFLGVLYGFSERLGVGCWGLLLLKGGLWGIGFIFFRVEGGGIFFKCCLVLEF